MVRRAALFFLLCFCAFSLLLGCAAVFSVLFEVVGFRVVQFR